jgi:hypothetical protein
MSLRDKILAANDRTFEEVYIPEWDCTVRVYAMSAGDKTRIMKAFTAQDGLPEDYFARLVYLCACDETGTRIFNESDIPELQEKSATAVSRIAEVAAIVSKIQESPAALAEKNSETTQAGLNATE